MDADENQRDTAVRRPDETPAGAAPAKKPPVPRDVVVAFVAGDRLAFDRVFELLKRDIFLVVRRFFKGTFDQEEAFQEAWMQIHRGRGRFDVNRHQDLAPWARQVTRNRCLDMIKARKRRPEIPVDRMETPCAPSQLQALSDTRLRQVIARFVDSLGADDKQLFELCFVRELSHHEIAGEMDISVRRSKYLKKKLLGRLLKNAPLRRMHGG